MAISQADGSIILTTQVDTSGVNKGLSSIQGAAKKAGAVIAAAFAAKQIIQFSKAAGELATKTEASVLRLVDIYGQASEKVGDFIDANARGLGMSKAAAASYASVYGNLFSVWADQAKNAELTNQYLNMTAVVASKTGRTVEDVQERIRSGLLGNTEAIEDLGVFVNVKTIEMTDAFQRMANGRSWEQLSAYEQQQIRTLAILEQSTQKYGFEVAQTSALARSQFNAAFQDFKNTWGQVVNRVLMPILQVGTKVLNVLTTLMQNLFNISSKTIQNSQAQANYIGNSVDNQNALTEAVEETAKAQKGALSGFDELNTLSQETADATGASTGLAGGLNLATSLSLENTDNYEKDVQGVVDRVKKITAPILEPLKRIFNVIWTKTLEPFVKWCKEDLWPVIGDDVTSAFESLGEIIGTLEKPFTDLWVNVIDPIITELKPIFEEFFKSFSAGFSDLAGTVSENGTEIGNIIEAIGLVIQLVWSIIQPIIRGVIEGIGQVLSTTNDFIGSIISIVGNFIGIFSNLFKGMVALFKGNTDEALNYFKQGLASFVNFWVGIANAIISVINNLWTLIFDSFKGTVNAIGGLVSKIGSFFGAKWNLYWNAKAPLIPPINKYVPKLAQGAVIPPNREFLAVLGDQKHGTNIEAPLDTIKQAFVDVLSQMNNRDDRPIILQVDGREIARADRSGQRRLGSETVTGGFANVY